MTGTIPAMRQIKFALGFLALLAVVPAAAQQFPTVPDHTVVGRIGTGSSSGPSQAIPFSLLAQNNLNGICQTDRAFIVYSLSSAAWVCSTAPSANTVYAGPTTGAAAQPTFRALVNADVPAPTLSALGGIQAINAVASNWIRSISTSGVPALSQPAFSDISGVATGAQLPNPSASTLGGVQSKTVVSHQFLNTISTSGVPGSAQPACADVSDATVYCNAARGQLPGETSTGAATAGNVGEYIESVIASGSATSLTTGTPKTITSISLTAGDWDVSGNISFITAASTSVTGTIASISGTTNVLDSTAGKQAGGFWGAIVPGASTPAFNQIVGPYRLSLSGTTTVFLVGEGFFTVSTLTGYGIIRARRAR